MAESPAWIEKFTKATPWSLTVFAISVGFSIILVIQHYQTSREYAEIKRTYEESQKAYEETKREYADLKHATETAEIWRAKGFYDAARQGQDEYFKLRQWGQRVLAQTSNSGCRLPNDLAVMPAQIQFTDLTALAASHFKEEQQK